MKEIKLAEPSALEREVIRLITFTIAGYMVLSAIHMLWIMIVGTSVMAVITPFSIATLIILPAIIGTVLFVSKLKRNDHMIKLSLGATYAYQFVVTIYTAIIFDLQISFSVSSLVVGILCLILWSYYRVRDEEH